MKKTKIEFSDIQAGDLLETVYVAHGVKEVLTGIAFEKKERKTGFTEWWTSQGGTLIDTAVEYDAIYRIDVSEVSFEDIREGDLIEVSVVRGDVERIIRGRAVNFIRSNDSWYDGWATEDGSVMIRRRFIDKIVILERGA